MGNTAGKKEEWKTTLKSTTVQMLLKARVKLHESLVKLDEKETLAGAMKILNQDVTAGPVVGWLDVLDIADYIARAYAPGGKFTLTASGWTVPEEVLQTPVSKVVAGGRKKVLEFTPSTSLLEVLKKMTEEKIHRIAVVEKEGGLVTDILTQSDIIAFVVRHSYDGWFSEKADQSLELLGLAHTKDLRTCLTSDRVIDALQQLTYTTKERSLQDPLGHRTEHKVSALAVLNGKGEFTGILSAAQLRGLSPEHVADLALSVGDYLLKHGLKTENHCFPNTSFRAAVQALHRNHIHRLFIVDKTEHPIGVFTLSDIIRFLSETV